MSVFIGYPSFMAYQMMKGKKGNNDGFPSIPGMIARYSALGLTNEQMATNPVWVDKTGNGHDLQMKNFAWGGMSGVNGYVQNFNYFRNNTTVDKVRIDEQSSNSIKVTLLTSGMGYAIYIPKDVYQFNKSYFIKISSEGYNEGDLFLSFYAPSTSTATTVKVPLNPNGITEIPAIKEDDFLAVYLFNAAGKVGSITIEQLPLYPGALVFDGVDDYGTCDNFPVMTKEKGYTVVVLRQWISTPTRYTALVSKLNISTDGSFVFEEYNNGWLCGSFGKYTEAITVNNNNPISWQTSKSYNGESINVGTSNDTDVLSLGKLYHSNNQGGFANIALYSLVILDHDATEEELTKIKDYFVKTYPWLFPDQAWTVVGKTNEDEDRATIANITGNGNDLVLSNFGFIEGSGYNEEGEHAGYLVTDGVDDEIISAKLIQFADKFTIVGDWKFMEDRNDNAGLLKANQIYIYNATTGMRIYLKQGSKNYHFSRKKINALTSDGWVYDEKWDKYKVYPIGSNIDIPIRLFLGFYSSNFTKIALKNLGIYNDQLLSKDDCIKAYNYLQTLKAK